LRTCATIAGLTSTAALSRDRHCVRLARRRRNIGLCPHDRAFLTRLPSPLAVTLNTAESLFDANGNCTDGKAVAQLAVLTGQVVEFAKRFSASS